MMATFISKHDVALLLMLLTIFQQGANAQNDQEQKSPNGLKPAKILMFPFAHGFSSHMIDFQKMAKLLGEERYDLTVLINDHDRGYMEDISGIQPRILDYPSPKDPSYVRLSDSAYVENILTQTNTSTIELVKNLATQQYLACQELLKSTSVLEQIIQERFDLLIVDFTDTCGRVLVQYTQLPTVVYTPGGLSFDNSMFPNLPTIIPTVSTSFSDEMDFWERTQNVLRLFALRLITDPLFFDQFDDLKKDYIKRDNVPSVRKAFATQLIAAYSSWSLDYPRPLSPNVILVGGMHYEPGKPLRADLEEFIQGAGKAGIVVVSFGSMIDKIDPEKADNIAKALGQLKQRVIWRYAGPRPPSLNTENTLVLDWIPQNDLLAHKQTKVFVSHCGRHGAYEAIQNAVPVVATPVHADQFETANKLVRRAKMAVTVDIKTLTTETLLTAIHIVLNNERYKDNAIKASELLFDRPISAKDTFLFSVDFIIRHRGMGSLASKPISTLDTYQLYGLDVYLFLMIVIGLILLLTLSLLFFLCKFCIKCVKHCCGRKQKYE